MIELIGTFCLAIGACEDVSLGVDNITPLQCVILAQPMMAKWANEHPGYVAKGFTCGRVGRFAKA